MIYYKDSDRVCFSEKFEVKVYAIQEKFFTVTDIITVILCKRLHYMMRLCFRTSKKMKCQPFDMSLQFNVVGGLHGYLKAKD